MSAEYTSETHRKLLIDTSDKVLIKVYFYQNVVNGRDVGLCSKLLCKHENYIRFSSYYAMKLSDVYTKLFNYGEYNIRRVFQFARIKGTPDLSSRDSSIFTPREIGKRVAVSFDITGGDESLRIKIRSTPRRDYFIKLHGYWIKKTEFLYLLETVGLEGMNKDGSKDLLNYKKAIRTISNREDF
jgi:hypothetical protein